MTRPAHIVPSVPYRKIADVLLDYGDRVAIDKNGTSFALTEAVSACLDS